MLEKNFKLSAIPRNCRLTFKLTNNFVIGLKTSPCKAVQAQRVEWFSQNLSRMFQKNKYVHMFLLKKSTVYIRILTEVVKCFKFVRSKTSVILISNFHGERLWHFQNANSVFSFVKLMVTFITLVEKSRSKKCINRQSMLYEQCPFFTWVLD